MADEPTTRVTLDQVATAAGVSLSAASLALRGKPGVAADTRRRIVAAAKEIGYRTRLESPPPAASTIGLVLVTEADDTPEPTRDSMIGAITGSCADAGVDVRLGTMTVDVDGEPRTAPRILVEAGLDGFLVLGSWLSRSSGALFRGRPLVLIDGDPEDRDTCSNVVRDDAGGAGDATFTLIANGHRRIALVGTTPDAPPSIVERRRGFHEAMLNAGLEPRYVDGPASDPEAIASLLLLGLNRPRGRLTAIVAANDAVALAVIAAAGSRGMSVPSELSVIGFGDTDAGRLVRPRLSTVTVNTPAMGRLATAMLLHRIADPDDPPFTVIQRAVLVERERRPAAVRAEVGGTTIVSASRPCGGEERTAVRRRRNGAEMGVVRRTARQVVVSIAVVAGGSIGAALPASATPDAPAPLEIVAVDVSAFPSVAIDVALPARELADQVDPGMFTSTGVSDARVEVLDPADLTVALVVDDDPGVPAAVLAAHQGAAVELFRNLPAGVEVMIVAASGPITPATANRAELLASVGQIRASTGEGPSRIGPAVVAAALGLQAVPDARRQLIVMTAEGADLDTVESDVVSGALDRAGAAMRVVAVGEAVGVNLDRVAAGSGGRAVAVPAGSGTVLRTIDVLTTSLTDQYRLRATVTDPDAVGLRLTVQGRVYETILRGLQPPAEVDAVGDVDAVGEVDVAGDAVDAATPVPTSALPTTTTTTSTTTAPSSTTMTPSTTSAGASTRPAAEAPSTVAGVEAAFGLAAVALIVAVVVKRRRRSPVPASARRGGRGRTRP